MYQQDDGPPRTESIDTSTPGDPSPVITVYIGLAVVISRKRVKVTEG